MFYILAAGFPAAPVSAAAADPVIMVPASFASVAEKAGPAVVNISTVRHIKRGDRFESPVTPRPDDPAYKFFDKFFKDRSAEPEEDDRSLGSGFLIDPTGLIVTNNHVVEGSDDILVRMSDEREFHAQVVGRDPKTDLAVIRIKGESAFPHLELDDSDRTQVGDWVVAIGNPYGLDHTVTAGILSARGRALGAGPYDDFLQTDASINPGNSGGPLLNLGGRVIGINTAIIAGGNGIGFAIPSNLAAKIVSQLRDKGKVVRGWLGVLIQKVTPELARSFGLKDAKGALISETIEDGPAHKAGILRGDVIVSFDGHSVVDWEALPGLVADTPLGRETAVEIIRNGQTLTFKVVIEELVDEEADQEEEIDAEELGLSVQDLTPETAAELGLSKTEGVVISGVVDGSPADEAGLSPGDVIVEVNRQAVRDTVEFGRAVEDIGNDPSVLLLVRRGSNTLYMVIDLE